MKPTRRGPNATLRGEGEEALQAKRKLFGKLTSVQNWNRNHYFQHACFCLSQFEVKNCHVGLQIGGGK